MNKTKLDFHGHVPHFRSLSPGRCSAGTSCGSNRGVHLPGNRILFSRNFERRRGRSNSQYFEIGIAVWNLGFPVISELILYLTSLSGSLPLALFVFIAESMCIGRSAGLPGGADERVRVVENSKWKSVAFKSCFAPFWLVPARATKSFVVDLLFFVSKIASRRRPTCTI